MFGQFGTGHRSTVQSSRQRIHTSSNLELGSTVIIEQPHQLSENASNFYNSKRLKSRQIRTSSSRARLAAANLENLSLIDYGDAYQLPEKYFVKNCNFGKVYCCPKPKQNLEHVNMDPTLGGVCWKAPNFAAPFSEFNHSCKNTPMSTYYTRVIPWDHEAQDFVYGAAQDAEFKGYYDRRSLKSKIDQSRELSSWDPVSCYNILFWTLAAILAIVAVTFLILMIIFWTDFSGRGQWKWWVFWLVAIVTLIATFFFVFQCGANARAKKRFQRIQEACSDINQKNLHGTGTAIYPGENAAWLEVVLDPRRTMIAGPIRHDRDSHGLEQDVNVVERKQPTRSVIVEEILVNAPS